MHGISRIFTSAVDTVLWLAARSGQTELFSRQIWSCKATEAAPWEILSPFFQSLAVVPPVKYGWTVTMCECGCVCMNSSKLFCHAHMSKLTPTGFSCRISYLQIFGSDPDVFCATDRNRRHWMPKGYTELSTDLGGASASWDSGHTKQCGSQRGRIRAQEKLDSWQIHRFCVSDNWLLLGPLFFTSLKLVLNITDEVLRQFNEETSRQQADWR